MVGTNRLQQLGLLFGEGVHLVFHLGIKTMHNELVKRWFGNQFSDLHPLLQKLHIEGTPTFVPVRIIAERKPVSGNSLSGPQLIHFPNGVTAEISLTEDSLPRALEIVGSLKC